MDMTDITEAKRQVNKIQKMERRNARINQGKRQGGRRKGGEE